jgi:preprotein translocase subunit SecB
MSNYVSFLNFETYSIQDFVFRRNRNFISEEKDISIDLDFSADAVISEDKTKATILLGCSIFSEEIFSLGKSPFYLDIKMEGFFTCNPDVDIYDFEINGIAILLPYLRSVVTSFTAQAGMAPIIIPPINVYNLIEGKDKPE